jgi:hypothetical protein
MKVLDSRFGLNFGEISEKNKIDISKFLKYQTS